MGSSEFLGYENLCGIIQRYQNVRAQLRAKGISNPLRIANVLGPRFINYPDWINADFGPSGVPSPLEVYKPAPQTWISWELAANKVENQAEKNLQAGFVQPISIEHVLDIFTISTKYLMISRDFRKFSRAMGRAWEKNFATPLEQIERIKNIEYPWFAQDGTLTPGKKLLTWRPTLCLEDREKAFQDSLKADPEKYSTPTYWKKKGGTFLDAKGVKRQCGYIDYVPGEFVAAQMQAWAKDLNASIASWNQGKEKEPDLFWLAAHAQRRLVAIHPFQSGNGRTSRLIMDEILMSLGLPPPILLEMDADLGTSELEWAKTIAEGSLRTIEILEKCASAPESKGCNVVPSL